MSVPRTLSLSGLLVTLACTLAACGGSDGSQPSAQAPAPSQPATTSPAGTTSSLSAADQMTIKLTKDDPPACNFFTPAQIKSKLLSNVKMNFGIPTQCTYASDRKNATQNIGFYFLSKGLIQATIAKSSKTGQTVRGAWDVQKAQAVKQPGYLKVTGLKDSAYAQQIKGQISVLWFVKDHAYYLIYNYSPEDSSQKKEVSLKELVAFAKTVPEPSKVSKKLTAATAPDGASVTTQ